ncbi:phage tail sheath C-terminal domain-containing protein [Nannocystis exedens]|uniref:phage tail sheath C-terminal domain-containing protein n=1 Tax=Nannocystis exedens TaxID=54 RepID=UPI000BBA04E8|nr:phage tail sheath C-terminal domain-containing protein [Nannocystis exedens]PCC73783.1 Phage tail sheath protein [Nannocystis exedens]
MANIGINLVEVDGRATPSIQGAATSVAGFIVRTKRGVPGKVRMVTNFSEFLEHFGGFMPSAAAHDNYFGAYAIKGFFDNGGAIAHVTRVFGTGVAATATSTDGDENDGPLTVTAGYRGQADPGAWGNKISVDIVYRAAGQPDVAASFDITVKYDGRQVEFWDHLPPGPGAVAKVNDEFSGSKYITIAFDPAVNGGVLVGESLTLGSGAQDSPDADALEDLCIAALGLYDTIDIQLLACPDCTTVDFAVAGTDYCALRGDCIFVTDAGDVDVSGAQAFTPTLRGNNIYGAVYWPYIRVNDPIGTSRWVPATGHVLGVMARTERERGVWKAPAGVAARVQGALDVRHHISDPAHTTLVKGSGVNAVRFISGQGIVVDSARTLSTNSLWQFINVRLLFNFVKSSLKNGLRWVVYEPNDEVLWNKVKHNAVTPFLMSLWRRGAFGPGSPEDVFSVKCDGENNPSNNVQAGILNVEVYFYPSRPAETFIITVGQQEGGPTASEG